MENINRNKNLKDYIMNNYVKYFDLTKGRELELSYLLGICNASLIDVEQFKDVFGLQEEGFFGVLKYLVDGANLDKVIQYGNMCLNDNIAQRESMNVSQGISL